MENLKTKVYTLLGFAQKAGKIISGSATVEVMIGKPDCKLVIIAEDAAQSYSKQIVYKCEVSEQTFIIFGTKDELGNAIGKSQRTAVIVKDINIAKAIRNIFKSLKQL